ncbi:MAG: LysR family transcriptional regulator [Oxalobacteraceae bacterium]|nr:LysR family transcriptional regulator [Oxalobacteraceae bacterium]
MNIKHLRHLLAIAETGSFSRAADRTYITQSALSRSIQSLEEELGGALIDRIGKKNELTPLGHEVVAQAQGLVLAAEELRRRQCQDKSRLSWQPYQSSSLYLRISV